MITAVLAVAGVGATVLSLLVIGYVVYALRDAVADQRASLGSESLAVQARFVAEAARDGYKAQAAAAQQSEQEARADLVAAQLALNAARKELVDRVQREIVSATPADAGRMVDELLAQPLLPAAAGAAGSGAADSGDAGPTAVQPAPAADAGGAGRSS